MVAVRTMEEKMRLISQSELLRLSRLELTTLLRKIVSELSALPEGSNELRIAHYNLYNIRLALARPEFRPRCASGDRRKRDLNRDPAPASRSSAFGGRRKPATLHAPRNLMTNLDFGTIGTEA
jgi:hypothetical protein